MTDTDLVEAYVRRVQADTRRYVHDLLAENEKLRVAAATLQAEKIRIEEELLTVRQEMDRHRLEGMKLERHLAEIAAENRRFSEEYVLVEQQNSNLANLYVASSRLHSTLDRKEILAAIIDIIEFLVGCEQIAIFDQEDGKLRLAASKGIDERRWAELALGEGPIGRTALTGQPYVPLASSADEDGLTVCMPLRIQDRVSGVIALFRLLPQKSGRLESVDFDLLNLLAAQAGAALATGSVLSRIAPAARPSGDE